MFLRAVGVQDGQGSATHGGGEGRGSESDGGNLPDVPGLEVLGESLVENYFLNFFREWFADEVGGDNERVESHLEDLV